MAKPDKNYMLNGPLLPGIIRYTIPVILTGLLQMFFNAADLIVVGRYCGSISVAAVGATGAITRLIINVFIGISTGAGVAIARSIGAKDEEDVHKSLHTAILTALIGGGLLTAIGVPLAHTFLSMMDTPETVLPLSTIYMQICFAGMTFTMVYNFAAAILRAAGDTRSPLRYLTIAGVMNVVLNVFFVTALDMNVAGVALATIISQGFSAGALVVVLMRRTDACRFIPGKMRIYKRQLMEMVRIGVPAGLQSSLFSISNVLVQSSINSFGDVVMSGHSSAQNIDNFVWMITNCFHQTAVNFVGQNSGAKQYKRVGQIMWRTQICMVVTGLASGLLVLAFAPKFLGFYITDSPEAIEYGLLRMSIFCVSYWLCGLMDVTVGGIRGMGISIPPMVVSILGICGMRVLWVTTIFRIPQFHTLESLYISYPISWGLTFLLQLAIFIPAYRSRRRQYPEETPTA